MVFNNVYIYHKNQQFEFHIDQKVKKYKPERDVPHPVCHISVFLLFTASVRSRPPGPPAVPGVFLIVFSDILDLMDGEDDCSVTKMLIWQILESGFKIF